VNGARGGFCTEAEGKTEARSGRVHGKEGEGGGSARGRRVERRMEEGKVRSSDRARDRQGQAMVCPTWQHGSKGEGEGVRSGWPQLGRCHGPAQEHTTVL
jgi:hypothetical protein